MVRKMKQLRRLEAPRQKDAYRKAQRGLLRYARLSEQEFRDLQRERPRLVVVDGDAVLIGQPRQHRMDLQYAYPDRDAFMRLFAAMFQKLAAAVRQEEAPLGYRFRLLDRPSRPYVEQVLFAQAFEPRREWMEMALADLPPEPLPAGEVAPGFTLRPARAGDAGAIVALEDLAFPSPELTEDAAREALDTAAVYRVLEEKKSGELAGSLLAEVRPPATGHIATVAVHPRYRRRGLGEAMVRWALGWCRREGLRRATLTVNTDNAPAIALYRKLGFAPGRVGLDYRRPVDEDEVAQVLEKRRGSVIKFGGWR